MVMDEKKKKYTPLNATSAPGINYQNYQNEVAGEKQYAAENPTAVQGFTTEEFNAKYGHLVSGIPENSKDTNRVVPEGTSGADEELLDNRQYAALQSEKETWAEQDAIYQRYKDSTDPAEQKLAQDALASRDAAHLNGQRIRAMGVIAPYSGGADGSMYIPLGQLEGAQGGTGGGSGSNGGTGGSEAGGSAAGVEDYSAWLEQMYAAKKAAAVAELNAAYEKNVNGFDRAEAGLNGQYQAARNLTAGQSEQLKRNFAQYAAANGLNSGTAGQAELARGVTLQNNMNSINTAEADALANLQLQRANAEAEYNNAIAQAQASGDYELAYALYQEKVRVQEALIELEIWEQEQALKQYQLQYQAQRDSVSDSQWAQELALKQDQLKYQAQRDSISDSQWAQDLAFQQQKHADASEQEAKDLLAAYGEAFLARGLMPSAEMLEAMGMTAGDAWKYIASTMTRNK